MSRGHKPSRLGFRVKPKINAADAILAVRNAAIVRVWLLCRSGASARVQGFAVLGLTRISLGQHRAGKLPAAAPEPRPHSARLRPSRIRSLLQLHRHRPVATCTDLYRSVPTGTGRNRPVPTGTILHAQCRLEPAGTDRCRPAPTDIDLHRLIPTGTDWYRLEPAAEELQHDVRKSRPAGCCGAGGRGRGRGREQAWAGGSRRGRAGRG